MNNVNPAPRLRTILMLTTGLLLIATTEGAVAKSGNNSGDHKDRHSEMRKDKDDGKYSKKHKDKDDEKHAKKHKKDCDKIIVPTKECGVSSKDPVGNTHPDPGKGTTAGTGTTTGTGSTNGGPPPAAPGGDPVVRDHRPGGNAAGLTPGTIIRDHRNGADGTPMIVVRNSAGTIVTRRATDAELEKAGLKKTPAPTPVEVPIGAGGGGR